ncbi:MAG: nitronate monooxygenase [bacterium]
MIKTRITEMLGIKYPILQGGMQWLSRAEMAAAVANAGGLGFVSAMSFATADELRAEIRRAREMTDKPIGVNVSMLPMMMPGEMTDTYFSVILEEGIPVVETSGRNPEPYIPRLKEAGVKIIHKVPAVRFARKAESVGVDAVTIVGFECGGHPGMDDVPSLILIPKAAQTLKIPIIAAGGFCDGRGLVAALSLGAEAILMGTRFMATMESPMHENFKQWLISAQETDTMLIERSIRNAARVIRNDAAKTVEAMETKGATLDELLPIISGKVGRDAYLSGDINLGVIACGQVAGRINEIKSVKQVIDDIITEAHQILGRLNRIIKS